MAQMTLHAVKRLGSQWGWGGRAWLASSSEGKCV